MEMATQFDSETDLFSIVRRNNERSEYTRQSHAHSGKKGELDREHNRVESEISAAVQAGDVNAIAVVLPRRDAVALLRARLEQEKEAIESLGAMERETEERREDEEARARGLASRNRAGNLTHARQLNAKWDFAMPLSAGRYNDSRVEPLAAAKAEYDRLVEENNLQEWELSGNFDPQGNWVPGV